MFAIKRVLANGLVLVSAVVGVGCAGNAGTEPTGSTSEPVQTDHYQYGSESLQAKMQLSPQGPLLLLDGPDNARIAELLGEPAAGVIVDPSAEHSFWIYTNDAERNAATAKIQATLVLKPGTPSLPAQTAGGDLNLGDKTLALGVGCLTPGITLFENINLGGQTLFVNGTQSDLRTVGFNDRASSLTFVSGTAILYENLNFSGHSITFVPDLSVRLSTCGSTQSFGQINALTAITMSTTLFFFHTSWNDQATSVIFAQTEF